MNFILEFQVSISFLHYAFSISFAIVKLELYLFPLLDYVSVFCSKEMFLGTVKVEFSFPNFATKISVSGCYGLDCVPEKDIL
jgi:hypothetical protein